MKIIITENRFNNLLDKLFEERYDGPLIKREHPDGYVNFFDSQPFSKSGIPFELNAGGTLWLNDYYFYKKLKKLFSLETTKEITEFFKNYFGDRYGVNVKTVASEGGYHKPGDDPDDDDPWLDDDNI